MSKVQTLLKVIQYQKEHPGATDAEIASVVRISERYVSQCRKDIQELEFYLDRSPLERNEIDLMLSKLNPDVGLEKVILHKLQKTSSAMRDGLIRIALPTDKPSKEYLQIGICAPKGNRQRIDFWLENLLYDPLLRVNGDDIEYRLASVCENIEGYSRWHIKLREDILWSDGKPVTPADVIDSLARERIAEIIKDVERSGKNEFIIILKEDDALFQNKLGYISILPSHAAPYHVTGGPFILRESRSPVSFHLHRNRDYYKVGYPKIDWIKLRTYARPAFAIKAVMEKRLDMFPLSSLHQIRKWASADPQSLPFSDPSYYLLLVNRRQGLMADEDRAIQLREAIDYNAVSFYLSGTLTQERATTQYTKHMSDLKMGYIADMPSVILRGLTSVVASSLGVNDSTVVDLKSIPAENVWEGIDTAITQLYFGHGYCRLRRYFHSEGENNTFRFSCPDVDLLIEKLGETYSMKEREAIGRGIIQRLQEENALILLAPHLQYILSNLYITPSPRLTSVTDLILSLPDVHVKRGCITSQTD